MMRGQASGKFDIGTTEDHTINKKKIVLIDFYCI